MTPFYQAHTPEAQLDYRFYMERFKVDRDEAERMAHVKRTSQYFLNDLYQVDARPVFGTPLGPIMHLSIKRRDREVIRDWRHLQQIKNEIVGPEHEAIEVYPAESRLVDMAHQFHLWVFLDPSYRVPIGWTKRMVATPDEAESVGAKQRAMG